MVVESVTPQVAKQQHLTPTSGALVAGLSAGGPAAKAGVEVGDVIVSLAGSPVTDAATLIKTIGAHAPGDTVPVDLYRGSQRSTVSVTLGSAPS